MRKPKQGTGLSTYAAVMPPKNSDKVEEPERLENHDSVAETVLDVKETEFIENIHAENHLENSNEQQLMYIP